MQIEMIKVGDIKPYEKNARKHQKEDVKAIEESIREFGFLDPIGIWGEDNIIVEGHGRLQAAKNLGMETVPVIRLDELTDEQRRAYALAHNKTAELSEWDLGLLDGELNDIFDIDMAQFGFELDGEEEPAENEEENNGGLTDAYLSLGTYVKSFYSVMYSPSCVKVSALGDGSKGVRHERIHHRVDWAHCTPMILNERWKKQGGASK